MTYTSLKILFIYVFIISLEQGLRVGVVGTRWPLSKAHDIGILPRIPNKLGGLSDKQKTSALSSVCCRLAGGHSSYEGHQG